MLLTIWTLANPEAFRSVADRFGLPNRGTAHFSFMNICKLLKQHLGPSVITWPSASDCSSNASSCESRYGFPGVVGCMDGCHIPLKPPAADRDSYINRKGFPSLNLLAVCDHNMKFMYTFSDCPGSVHDARVLRSCSLGEQLLGNQLFDNPDHHVLGDSAYPLLPGVLVPFRDNGHLSEAQVRYNALHSAARCVIERAFGRLKGKFRRLKMLDVTRVDYAPIIVEAACILHNVCLGDDADFDDGGLASSSLGVDGGADSVAMSRSECQLKEAAKAKRDVIMSCL